MRKKLQIFISSTYVDLQEERQAAVEAILASNNIPAGMELFKAGNNSQWETIKKCLRHFNSPSPSFMRGIRGFFLCRFRA